MKSNSLVCLRVFAVASLSLAVFSGCATTSEEVFDQNLIRALEKNGEIEELEEAVRSRVIKTSKDSAVPVSPK